MSTNKAAQKKKTSVKNGTMCLLQLVYFWDSQIKIAKLIILCVSVLLSNILHCATHPYPDSIFFMQIR